MIKNKLVKEKLDRLSPEKRLFLEKRLKGKTTSAKSADGIPRRSEIGSVPLSFEQQRLWFIEQLEEDSAAYIIPMVLRIVGPLQVEVFERSLHELVQRHESLRTTFVSEKGHPQQIVHPEGQTAFQVEDLCEFPEAERLSKARQRIHEDFQRSFDLSQGPLFRCFLFKIGNKDHVFLLNMHHIISDSWSIGIFLKELTICYQALSQQRRPQLPDLAIQYADYAVWKRQWLTGQTREHQMNYWRDQLKGLPLFELPTDKPRPPVVTYHGAFYTLKLPDELSHALKAFSDESGASLFMTLMACFVALMSRYSGEEDIVFGSPITNRTRKETEPVIGFFVNTLIFRIDLAGNPRFQELLERVKKTVLDAFTHQDIPFEQIVEELQPERDMSRNPLVQVLFDLQNTKMLEDFQLPGLTMSPFNEGPVVVKMDMEFQMRESAEGLHCDILYNTDLFEKPTVARMVNHFKNLLIEVMAEPKKRISEIVLLSEWEKQQLRDWNQTRQVYSAACIPELFERQVEQSLGRIAVVDQGQSLTYQALNAKANQLAHYLISLGVRGEITGDWWQPRRSKGDLPLVGICVERSLELIIGLWGILKAGGAYVPLDPDYPPERLQFMLEDSNVSVLLSQSHLWERLPITPGNGWLRAAPLKAAPLEAVPPSHGGPSHEIRVVNLDSDWEPIVAHYSQENPVRQLSPKNLAYVIYTSGSTGAPKGVMVEHHALSHFSQAAVSTYGLSQDDRVLQFASINFDAAAEEIYPILLQGGCLVLRGKAMLDTEQTFLQTCQQQAITVLDLPTAYWQQLITTPDIQTHWPESVRLVIIGGEAASLQHVRYWQKNVGEQTQLLNTYGPTEATVVASSYQLTEALSYFPIGTPIPNTQIYILDSYLNPVPLGVPGELCIAGQGLARGYLGRLELTNEKFIDIELLGQKQRIYKTGDLARLRAVENHPSYLEYLGRLDHQVKLRGFRIELGEIETQLCQHGTVQDAVVVLYQENNPRLVAYLTVARADIPQPDVTVLRTWLKARLPEYMVPSQFIVLDNLPLTPNGKIDRGALSRKKLPSPDLVTQTVQQAPQTEIEKLLCPLWSQVLGGEITSIHSDFFIAGGHSLLATQLVSRIRESFGVEMPLRMIFEKPLLSEQAEWLEKEQRGCELPPIQPLEDNEPLVLSFAQQRLWFLAQLEGLRSTYNMPAALRLFGPLNQTALERALIALVQRHTSLRCCFPVIDGEATLQLTSEYNPLSITNLRKLPKTERFDQIHQWVDDQAQAPFDLSTGPLFRVHLLSLDSPVGGRLPRQPQEHVLLFNMHHIISDGWSIGVLLREWSQLYRVYSQEPGPEAPLAASQTPQLPELGIQYTDYAVWQRNWLTGEVLERQLTYWTEKLTGAPELLEIPTDFPRPAVMRYQGQHWQNPLAPKLMEGIKQLSQKNGVTPFMSLLAAFNVLLYRYSRQTDLVIGSPIANRTHYQTENLIGFFVNTLVLRTQMDGDQTFSDLLKQVRQTALEAYSHQDIPFEYLVEQLNPSRSLSHSPLFQVMFSLQNETKNVLELSGLTLSYLEPDYPIAKFDLTLNVAELKEGWVCSWEYNTDLFRAETITRMAGHFQVLLESILQHPEQALSRLPLLTEAEQRQWWAWNQTETRFPLTQTVVDLFQEQVAKTPETIAVVGEKQALCYEDLNGKANQLAHYLMASGVGRESLVGICVERSIDMVIGLLGILKAGGAYVPLDPEYPQERLKFMLEDSAVPILLSQSHLQNRLPISTAKVVCLDSGWEANVAAHSRENPVKQSRPDDLAYVIYTSGSTGNPKGVMIEHKSLINLCFWHIQAFSIQSTDRATLLANNAFDASVWELWPYLITGASVMPTQLDTLLENNLWDWLAENQISISFLPTPVIENYSPSSIPKISHLRWLLTGGDTLHQCPDTLPCPLVNNYGPTENTVVTTSTPVKPQDGAVPTIGRPIHNVQVYILDAQNQIQPPGLAGELCIAGAGLARGYLNRPELTNEKFIDIEIPDGEGHSGVEHCQRHRVYKTGDLARLQLNPDGIPGSLEFLGRLDHQIKLRGFRIELGEIEALLIQHKAVKEAVVVLYKNDNPRLVAYVTLTWSDVSGLTDDKVSVLRTWLETRLPSYMVPSHFTVLDQLPLTPNGKIDRSVLLRKVPPASITQAQEEAPQTDTEQLLCHLWSQVLGMDITSSLSHFFEVGGHSLLATQLVSRVRKRFGIEMPLRIIFEHPLVKDQATWLEKQQRGGELPPIKPVPAQAPLVLSFAQQRLWFLAQLEGLDSTYHIPTALHLSGPLNQIALERALTALVQRHTSLRCCFPVVDGEATLQINDVDDHSLDSLLNVTDFSHLSKREQPDLVNQWISDHGQAPFDLNTGPLFRVHLLVLNEQDHILLLNMHHIISDGWSIGVLMREWSHCYNAYLQGKSPQLPELPIQYSDYAAWQRNWLAGDRLEQQLTYWMNTLTGIPELLDLPTDYPRPAVMSYQGEHLQSTLASEITQGIQQLSQKNEVTAFMTLLAAFNVLLYRYSRQTDLIVGSPIGNRTHHQTEEVIGFFVNTLVVRTHIKEDQSFLDLLKQVRQTALEAYAHQDVPFEYLVEQLNPTRSLSHSPLFQVMFDLQNVSEDALKLSGLKSSFLDSEDRTAKFDLTLSVAEYDDSYVCDWEYRTDLFCRDTITRMAEHFQVLLEGILNHLEQPLSQLPLHTKVEQQQLIAWNQTEKKYFSEKTIIDLFQEQVSKTPNHIAVVFEEKTLSYAQLNIKVNQLAYHLMSLGVGPETLVGICVERSLEMVIGLLGILKAGGAYVPLDPEYPPERLQFMLEDAEVPVLLSQHHLLESLPASTAKVVCLDREWEAMVAASSGKNPIRQGGPENLAYVIYTSGSTGMPKGVMIEHRALSNLCQNSVSTYGLSQEDGVLQFVSINFDTAAEEIYPILMQGGRLVLRGKAMLDSDQTFLQTCQQQGVTVLDLPTAYWQQLITMPDIQKYWPESVHLVVIGGEAALLPRVQHWQKTLGKTVQLVNAYGPTEATITASTYRLTESVSYFPIGKPIANTKIYILDKCLNPVPIGIPGELCIAGQGLARRYLNRPELTKEKFIEVELFGQKERIYKTGDLARLRSDVAGRPNNIEYLGRLDHQIKLRGFRIELGEIEARLCQHEVVQEAVIVLNEGENPHLVAYVTFAQVDISLTDVSHSDESQSDVPPVDRLRRWLKAGLPSYMVPFHFMVLEQMPLTPNGKIDRRALPAPDVQKTTQNYQVPRDSLELQLVQIWESLLERQPIGIFDDFFELGGNSLLAVRLMSQIETKLESHLPLAVLFQDGTIEKLAALLREQTRRLPWSPLVAIQTKGQKPPLFCVHPSGGNVLCYLELAQHLGHEQPFYGLQAFGLEDEQVPYTRVVDMATFYLKALQTVQPQGPYQLAGWSFGGLVAFEIARLLQGQGESVDLLALLDVTLNQLPEPEDDAQFLVDFFRIGGIELSLEHLRQLSPEEQLAHAVVQGRQSHLLPPDIEKKQLQRLLQIERAHMKAVNAYHPQCYRGKALLFQVVELNNDSLEKPDYGWEAYTTEGVEVIPVPGNHLNMITSPHVQTLAEQLKIYLK